jgi:hypothetical protein
MSDSIGLFSDSRFFFVFNFYLVALWDLFEAGRLHIMLLVVCFSPVALSEK